MTFLTKLLLGNGRLKPGLRAALAAEGLVTIEEGLPGSVRYKRFKAPGRRAHGKVTPERIGLAITEERLAVYCRSGRAKLIDTPFSDPRLGAIEVGLEDENTISLRIDFDRIEVPKVSGEITITARSPGAADIVHQLQTRLRR